MDPDGNAGRLTGEPTPKEDWWRQIAPTIMQMNTTNNRKREKKTKQERNDKSRILWIGKAYTKK